MNYKLLGILAVGLAIGCGDDTSGGGGSGGGTGGEGTGGTPEGGAPEGGAPEGGGGSTANMGGAGGGTGSCEEMHPEGADTAATLVITSCGCEPGSPCEADCADDGVCDAPGPSTNTEPCGTCIEEQAAMGAQSACVADAALGEECSNDPECSAYVQCVIAGG